MNWWQAMQELFGDAFVALWLAASLFAAGIGGWALLDAEGFVRWNRRLSRWITPPRDARPVAARTKRTVHVERLFYRHHRVSGTLLMVGSVYTLHAVLFRLDPRSVKAALAGTDPLRQMLIDAAFGYVYLVGIAVLFIGFTVLVRPSLLRGIESWSNRWVETGKWLENADKRTDVLNEWTMRHPRLFAIFALCGGFFSAFMIWRWYLQG